VIKFVSDLRQAGGFFSGTPISSTNKIEHGVKIWFVLVRSYDCPVIYLIFQNSFQQAKSWIKETMEIATNPVQIIMVGNKLDLANNGRRSVSEEVRD
jgi:hypothetical protein